MTFSFYNYFSVFSELGTKQILLPLVSETRTHTKLNIPFLDPTISDKNKELATRFDDKISQCLSKNSILSVYLCDYRDACIFCLYRERIELCIYFHRIFFIKVRSFSIVELLHEFLD
jgi:hypothetical protein